VSLQQCGDGENGVRTGAQPLSFVVEKEESLVLADRTSHGSAEDVVAQLRTHFAAVLDRRKETGRVHGVVAEELGRCAVVLIRPGLGSLDEHAASRSAISGRIVVAETLTS